ncbi:NAD(P)-binding protein [Glonium stellatum]|uniref:NAD(P)-binding protein n=1 Tax=Glonium stellatum TaxID=574774 RepID=A0A8E2JS57_9PEZI|nr:NAD(P)-binding protein [Glonium stellatum]
MVQKSVLVTGCSAGGIGASMAKSFQKRGFLVFATARNVSKLPSELTSLPSVETIALDVTSASSIAAAVDGVSKKTGGTLDVLVNNSGSGYTSPGLDVNIEKAKAMYDVNFWGVLAMIQAFAPMLIKAKGAIVNISSVSGELYDGYASMYASSKAALTNAGEAWRLELAPFGVRVVTVVTGVVASNFFANVPDYNTPEGSLYKPVEKNIREIEKAVGNFMPTDQYSERVVAAVIGGATGRLWEGNQATIVKYLSAFLPTFFQDMIMSRDRGFDKLAKAAKDKNL